MPGNPWGTDSIGPATLCFVECGAEVLLIEKKRGAGAGLMNAPGGKVRPGESPVTCAIREVKEEVGINIRDLEKHGEISFRIGGELFSFVHVFRTDSFSGTPSETGEGRPEWVHRDELPWESMWSGDEVWVPRILRGERLRGRVCLSADTESVLSYSFCEVSEFESGVRRRNGDRNSYRR